MKEQKAPAKQSDEQRREGLDEAGSRGNGDQSGDRAGDGAERGGLAVVNPLGDGPAEGGCGGGKVGVDEGAGGQRAGAQRAAGVESEPAHPEQTGADEAENHRVRRHVGMRIAEALAQIEGGDQRRDAGGDVDDGAAGEIEAGNVPAGGVEQAADAPDHVGHGAIDEAATRARERRPWR